MGVLACDRKGCDNIMCDYYSNTFGYLCWECYNELIGKCAEISIEEFMEQDKKYDSLTNQRFYVEEEFKNRFDED